MRSTANSVDDYLDQLPEDRQADMRALRDLILEHLPEGYEEAMNWGMITYQVPLSIFPDTYNHQPLMYAALASQKHYMSLYLTSVYVDPARKKLFEEKYKTSGKPLNAGKSCVRFKKISDLPLSLIAEMIAALSIEEFIKQSTQARNP